MTDTKNEEQAVDLEGSARLNPNMAIMGESQKGLEVIAKWVGLEKETRKVVEQLGEAADEEDAPHPICDEIKRLGFVGVVQEIAHLMALRVQVDEFINNLGGELMRHYSPEVEQMVEAPEPQDGAQAFGQMAGYSGGN